MHVNKAVLPVHSTYMHKSACKHVLTKKTGDPKSQVCVPLTYFRLTARPKSFLGSVLLESFEKLLSYFVYICSPLYLAL